MKTDQVLTMDEYPTELCIAPKQVSPPDGDAGHIPITAENDLPSETEAHGCRCDRWGHPCPGCLEHKPQTHTVSADFSNAKEMR